MINTAVREQSSQGANRESLYSMRRILEGASGSAAAVRLLQSLNRSLGTNLNVLLEYSLFHTPEIILDDETKCVESFVWIVTAPLGMNSTSNHLLQYIVMTLGGIQFCHRSIDRTCDRSLRLNAGNAVFPGTEVVASTAASAVSGAAALCFGCIRSCRPKSQGHKGDAYHCQRQQPPGLEYNSTIVHF